jgi:transcriptional regulator with XRE-family HTH domain
MLVQKLRLQKGWSQEQLAALSGLSVRTIQRIENGQSASVESLKALGAVFDTDFANLREPDMSDPKKESDAAHVSPVAGLTNEEALAFSRVRAIKGFYEHAAIYVIVIAGLVVINIVSSPHHIWAPFPAFGWGVGLLAHGLRAFDRVPFLNARWEKRKVEEYLGRPL